MPNTTGHSDKYISHVSLVGRSSALVKNLGGFRKQHHEVPDAVNAATTGFLAKIASEELHAEAEDFYQRTKTALKYKRADLSLDVAPPVAVMTARDFTLEWEYGLNESDPSTYIIKRELHGIRSGSLIETDEFDVLFARRFESLVFALAKGVKVEAVIDAVEALEGSSLRVDYPSDCRHCILRVTDITAELLCDGATLEMKFPKAGSPKELLQAFAEVRAAFALTKSRTLSGLL
jgi:hypothetical protein